MSRCESLASETAESSSARETVLAQNHALMRTMGANQNSVLRDEQRLLDSKLDLDAVRRANGKPPRLAHMPVQYSSYTECCAEVACVRARALLIALQTHAKTL